MKNLLEKDIEWVKKVVESCKTEEQFDVAEKCLDNLTKKWSDFSKTDKFYLVSKLSQTEKNIKSLIFTLKTQYL